MYYLYFLTHLFCEFYSVLSPFSMFFFCSFSYLYSFERKPTIYFKVYCFIF